MPLKHIFSQTETHNTSIAHKKKLGLIAGQGRFIEGDAVSSHSSVRLSDEPFMEPELHFFYLEAAALVQVQGRQVAPLGHDLHAVGTRRLKPVQRGL